MIDYEKLKVLLEACKAQDDMNKFAEAMGSLFEECTIETIAAMVEERDQHKSEVERLTSLVMQLPSLNAWDEIKRLKTENEALRKDASIQDLLCCNICRCMIQPANQLQVENEALRKDAKRYQWLRDKSESVHQFYMSTPIWFTGVAFKPDRVDQAIDAAMSGEAQ